MKRIGVDLRPLESPSGKRGIGYFTRNLFLNILSQPHPNISFVLFTFPKSKLPGEFVIGPNDEFREIPALYWPKRGIRRIDPLFSLIWLKALKSLNLDLIHIPSLTETYFLSVPHNIKSLVTIYDVIPLLFPKQYFSNEKAQKWYIQRLDQAKRASKIITISESSKKDIQKFLNIPSEKIEVIYGGVDERFKPVSKRDALKVSEKYKIKGPYILTVSTHSFHKNISRIFQAFKKYTNLNLVVVCKLIKSEEDDWNDQIKELGITDRVILTNFVPDEDLPYLYSGAELFLFPSLYEGLGLPVLEAFASGSAVIASDIPSLREIGGDAPFYVNPEKVDEIEDAISKIMEDSKLKSQLIKRGFSRVKKFSWKKASEQMLKIYDSH